MSSPIITGQDWPQTKYYESLDSTMLQAREDAHNGAAHGTCIVSATQINGRGRLGRIWSSKQNQGLYMTVLLRPPRRDDLTLLSLLAGIAVAEAVQSFGCPIVQTGVQTGLHIKWPNDIVISTDIKNINESKELKGYPGRKLAGVLLEMLPGTLNTSQEFLVDQCVQYVSSPTTVLIGIGINVSPQAEIDPAEEWQQRYIGLEDLLGDRYTRQELIKTLGNRVRARINMRYDKWLKEGGDEINNTIQDFDKYDILRGKQVKTVVSGQVITGTAMGIDAMGRLLLDSKNGITSIMSGEVDCLRTQ